MLYGDGIHVDTPAIQALLDGKTPLVELPMPSVCYLIDRPLKIYSHQELKLPRFAVIRLAKGSNCPLIENADPENGDSFVRLTGGVWDANNMEQLKNPFHFPHDDFPDYRGIAMQFRNITNFAAVDLTLKDPTTYGMVLDTVKYFTVENIIFDFNLGNPRPMNMDGVHLNGNCHYGHIRNLQGTCYDDLVALNCDEGSDGPITDITVDGIYSTDCHSAVRMLTVKNELKNIHITNVHGTFYQYCIGITKFYEGETEGYFDGIVLDNIYASKAIRYSYLHFSEEVALHSYVYPLIYIEKGTRVRSLTVSDLYRTEENVAVSTVFVDRDAQVDNLTLRNIVSENRTDTPFPLYEKLGRVVREEITNVRELEN